MSDVNSVIWGALVGNETTYADPAPTALTAASGILLRERSNASIAYQHGGKRQPSPTSYLGQLRETRKSGGKFECEFPIHMRNRSIGGPLSASVFPRDVHPLLRASGFTAEFNATGGPSGVPAWIYTLDFSRAGDSLYGEVLTDQEIWSFIGGYVPKMSLSAAAPGIPEWKFGVNAIYNSLLVTAPDDSAVLTRFGSLLAPDDLPLLFDGSAGTSSFEFGASTFPTYANAYELTVERELKERYMGTPAGVGANGLAGYGAGKFTPKIQATFKKVSTLMEDLQYVRVNGTDFAMKTTFGQDVNGQRVTVATTKAQLSEFKDKSDGVDAWVEIEVAIRDLVITYS